MSYHRSLVNHISEPNRDPRQRDRSRSDIRRSDNSTVSNNQSISSEQTPPTNSVIDFFKTLGLNAQLIQALINANPPKIEQIQHYQQQTPIMTISTRVRFIILFCIKIYFICYF